MKKEYFAIDHPSVSWVSCPYCGENRGAPCRRRSGWSMRNYCQTHLARVKKWRKQIGNVES